MRWRNQIGNFFKGQNSKQTTSFMAMSAIVTLVFIAIYFVLLEMNSLNFSKEFYAQNFKLIESSDSFSMISQLSSLSNQDQIGCITASQDQVTFFSTGFCRDQWLSRMIEVKSRNGRLQFLISYRLSGAITWTLLIIYGVALLASIIIIFLILRIQEIENRHLKAFNSLSVRFGHDIRSPLSALSILSSVPDLNTREARDLLKASSERIKSISQDLLDRTKIDPNRNLKIQDILLKDLIDVVVQEKSVELRDHKNLEIQFHHEEPRLIVTADPVELHRILSNLLNNSWEARPAQSPLVISISMGRIGNSAEIQIADNGNGIPKKILSQIGRKQVTTREDGFGIGTYNAFRIIQLMKGQIRYQSTMGKGTTVNIRLPCRLS